MERASSSGNGLIYYNPNTLERLRIMPRPPYRPKNPNEPQKWFNKYYYRYQSAPGAGWTDPTSIPDWK